MKNTQPDHLLTATHPGPKPGDFPLASVESRAAARAQVERLAEDDGPQDGDIFIDLGFLDHARAVEIIRILDDCRHGTDVKNERIPGVPKLWLRVPNGCNPEGSGQ